MATAIGQGVREWRVARILACVTVVTLIAVIIGLLGPLKLLPGTTVYKTALRCAGPDEPCTPVTLPDRTSSDAGPVTYRIEVAQAAMEGGFSALLIPRLSDSYALRVNGIEMSSPLDPGQHSWSRPVIKSIPAPVRTDSALQTIDITVSASPYRDIMLSEVIIGPYEKMIFRYNLILVLSVGMHRIGLGLCLFASIVFAVLDIRPRTETRAYRYLAVASLAMAVTTLDGVLLTPLFSIPVWTLIWTTAVHLSVFALSRFLGLHVGRSLSLAETVWLVAIAVSATLMGVLEPSQWRYMQIALAMVDLAFLTAATAELLAPPLRDRNTEDYFTFLPMAISLALIALYWLEIVGILPIRTIETVPFAPIFSLAAAFMHVSGQATIGLRLRDRFAARLGREITARTEELTRTHEIIREMERSRVVEAERQRILLDLHDGLGGQLVNMQAYLENSNLTDQPLEDALQAAMADLAIIMDSIDVVGDVTTLLGSLRGRVEPMLSRNGLKFDWRIEDAPTGLLQGPSHSIMLLRIIQEALTNIVKHARADTIIMECTRSHISISDNGRGIPEMQTRGGRGLANMRRRAVTIGATLDIVGSDVGTCISLRWG